MRTCLIPFVALAVLAAGCASAGASGPGVGGAAAVVPSNVVSFVAVSTDLAGKEWHGLGPLVAKQLPGVQQVAGDEVDTATLPGGKTVELVQPKDDAKLRAYVTTHALVARTVGAWTAIAKDAATLDKVASATSHLADDKLFVDAQNALPGNALVRVYADGVEAGSVFASIPGQLESQLLPIGAKYRFRPSSARSAGAVGTQQFAWLAAAVTSQHDGLQLQVVAPHGDFVANGPPRLAIQPIQPYAPALLDEIPAGALAVVDFQVTVGAFEAMPQIPSALKQLFPKDALDLPQDLDALLGGETALYLRPSAQLPEVTLVTSPADTAAASQTLDTLQAASPQLGKTKLYRAVIGGQFVVSTTPHGIAAFRGGGARLSADPAFLDAAKRAGLPDRTTGFVYADLRSAALPLLALAGVKLPSGVPGLDTLTAFGAQADGSSTFTAFLGVG